MRHLAEHERALAAGDILEPRTKRYLHHTPAERQAVEHWLRERQQVTPRPVRATA